MLRVFNPEHDIVLASEQRYTTPHTVRQLRADLDFLPALWAHAGDTILVEQPDKALTQYQHICALTHLDVQPLHFITQQMLHEKHVGWNGSVFGSFDVWGMDRMILEQLTGEKLLNTDIRQQLAIIRQLSSRQWCSEHLQLGVSYISDIHLLRTKIMEMHQCVLKAPWSCTGRGIRYIDLKDSTLFQKDSFEKSPIGHWAMHVISRQGGILVEPYYKKIMDVGIEYYIDEDGKIREEGLSLFHTVKGAYSGNLLASEGEKEERVLRYVDNERWQYFKKELKDKIQRALRHCYRGPLGVDLMIVPLNRKERDNHKEGNSQEIDIIVAEMNLRRTMGHVALALTRTQSSARQLMRVSYDGHHYHLQVNDLQGEVEEATWK